MITLKVEHAICHSVIRLFNNNLSLTTMIIIKDPATTLEQVATYIIEDNTVEIMALVKEKKIAFDPAAVSNYSHVKYVTIVPYLIIKN